MTESTLLAIIPVSFGSEDGGGVSELMSGHSPTASGITTTSFDLVADAIQEGADGVVFPLLLTDVEDADECTDDIFSSELGL